jgi:hypothetical protein
MFLANFFTQIEKIPPQILNNPGSLLDFGVALPSDECVFEIGLGIALLGKHVKDVFHPEVYRDKDAAIKRGEEVFSTEENHFFTERPTGIDVKVFGCSTELASFELAKRHCNVVWRKHTPDIPS